MTFNLLKLDKSLNLSIQIVFFKKAVSFLKRNLQTLFLKVVPAIPLLIGLLLHSPG